jgi:hypothetical protein
MFSYWEDDPVEDVNDKSKAFRSVQGFHQRWLALERRYEKEPQCVDLDSTVL